MKPTLEDLHGNAREIAEAIGLEALTQLAQRFGGDTLYIPTEATLTRKTKIRAVATAYDGANIPQLIRAYGLSRRTIQRIVAGKAKAYRNRPLEGQMTLFD